MEGCDDPASQSRIDNVIASTMKTARDAHSRVMASGSEAAKYNSGILRRLEKAFAKDPEANLLEKLPSHYSTAFAGLADHAQTDDVTPASDPLAPFGPPQKRIKLEKPSACSKNSLEAVPEHLRHLLGAEAATVKSKLADHVEQLLDPALSSRKIIDVLQRADLIFRDSGSGNRMILRLGADMAIKIVSDRRATAEYEMLLYLQRNCPDVPAPKPMGLLELNGNMLMFMTYIPGESLEEVWPSLDKSQKAAISTELDHIFNQVRSHQIPAGHAWGGLDGNGCVDRRRDIRKSDRRVADANSFGDFYFSEPKYGSKVWLTFLRELYDLAEADACSPDACVLTHGDLRQANIIINRGTNDTMKIAGIIDWEYSGFYPAFWEAAKVTNCMGSHEESDWYLHLPPAISPQRYPRRWLIDLVWDRHVD